MADTKTIAFHTLGCKLNFSETSSLSRMLEQEGFEKKEFTEQADVYVINTRKRPTFGEKLGLQAAQMAENLIPTVLGKLVDSIHKANSSIVQMRDPKF